MRFRREREPSTIERIEALAADLARRTKVIEERMALLQERADVVRLGEQRKRRLAEEGGTA